MRWVAEWHAYCTATCQEASMSGCSDRPCMHACMPYLVVGRGISRRAALTCIVIFTCRVKQAPQYAVTFLMYDLAKAWLAAENGNGAHATGADPTHAPPDKARAPEHSGSGWSPLRGLRVHVSSA